ncbi:MAG TPA: HD domain-containing phosphohydrolase [Blastocatellia bacterium]|nr:HD domain-containing phosphohydrolase [Blastocatellia bacterium]
MTTTELNPPMFVADLSAQAHYSSSALSELQKISQLDEAAEYGAVLTLHSEVLVQATQTAIAMAGAPRIGLGFLNQINHALRQCTSAEAVVESLLFSTQTLRVATHSEAWLYDRNTQRLQPSQAQTHHLIPANTIEAVFATGEARRGSLPLQQAEFFYLCVPLASSKQIYGVCYLGSTVRAFSRDELEMLTAIGNQAGAVLETLHVNAEQERVCENMIQGLALTIDARDEITAGHSGRVASYSAAIARYMKLSEREQRLAYYAGLLHDYGKIGVRDEVLCKPSQLTAEEYEEIKQHPEYTLSILSKIKFSEGLAEVPHVASCHHERPDGKGYPRGLKRHEIPIGALIIAVADVFDALTVKRHYRDPMPLDEVLALLEAGRDTQFDGAVIDAFKQYYEQEYLPRQKRSRR